MIGNSSGNVKHLLFAKSPAMWYCTQWGQKISKALPKNKSIIILVMTVLNAFLKNLIEIDDRQLLRRF